MDKVAPRHKTHLLQMLNNSTSTIGSVPRATGTGTGAIKDVLAPLPSGDERAHLTPPVRAHRPPHGA